MGLMDFLRKKSDNSLGLDSSTFDTKFDPGTLDMNNLSSNQGMEFQPEHNLNPSVNLSTMAMNNTGFGQTMQQSMPSSDIQKDLEMISLKLDAIKSELDAMNQRLKSLESIAEREQMKTGKKWY
ncbi:MAG: hypothetical protein ACP5OA_07095 [Candidatus Woesearchaeota archaeon]